MLDINYQLILAGLGAAAGALVAGFVTRLIFKIQLSSLRRQLAASESSRLRAQELLKQARQQADHLFRQQERARLTAGEPPNTRPSGLMDLPEVRVFESSPRAHVPEARPQHAE